jgi:hypothetical protein
MIYITTEDEIDEHVFPSELSRIKEKLVVTHYGTGIAYDCPIEKHYFVIPSVLKERQKEGTLDSLDTGSLIFPSNN